ncbi:hypothetical protein DKX38_026466 [Salix brachista]|uniref:Uncharacterized protein n=1 Tax=Salix brachista TaxID=2182728 RepID=A0A5N5J9J1_9ROSI|nr:hypothetical protein DKX38_026466 [Salix brachista]
MDTKALAKSKRAHTLQHNKGKKPHPNQKPSKTPSTGNDQKTPKSKLPSNWDRYEDDEEGESGVNPENPSGDKISFSLICNILFLTSLALCFVRNPATAGFCDEEMLKCLVTEESMHGVGPLLAVRGESILSWIGDDNFVVEDETTSSHEASFLSLNLHALAEQLAKVDVSERLFIEADLLPTEMMQTRGSEASSSHENDRKQTTPVKETKKIFEEFTFEDFSKKNKAVNQDEETFVSGLTIGNSGPISFIQGLDDKDSLNLNQHGKSNQSSAMESPAQFHASSVAPKSRLPAFEAEAAESELDMLLDSLSENKLLDSSGFGSGSPPFSGKEAPVPLPQLTRNAPGSAKTTSTAATLDSVLDDLLEETSNLQEAAAPFTTSTAATLDDVLDDLFEETSNLSNQNNLHQPSEKKAAHAIQSSSSQSVSKSQVLDDFDSWLDTI